MKRKVNKVGQNTLTVSLPTKWVKKIGVQQGDEIDVLEEDSSLIINATKKDLQGKSLNYKLFSSDPRYVRQAIRALYISGVDELRLEFDKAQTIIIIQKEVDLLLGFEILDQKDNSCHIKCVSEPLEEEFNILSRKVFLLTISMAELIYDNLKKNKPLNFKQISDLHKNIHRFASFCRRMLVKKSIYGELKSQSAYFILVRAMMIKNNFYYLSQYLDSKKKYKINKSVLEYFNEVISLYRLFYEMFFKNDIKMLADINTRRDELMLKKMPLILEKEKGEGNVVLHYLAENVRLISTAGSAQISYSLDSLIK
ncbi:hypothetical protein HN695_04330 [Candidatus Woesearchaeota archaeon]|jgi:phosphate uptake regulator|nr:hypothetical protein [Candidatus Woesearchaeota archaeon]MBT5272377.1 hypothetical protein [Candidatus Woesearchaeota archaeon]MBT6041648.1 hypothetical protein [Candidatus Woesearchaeota archaeon]MBT6336649.1 hypothetical protein [Candidatus Woesearchaeota archaeon]MBT7927539.1 hypothetical protein [Candidatus Woesearchaeota archaeon]